MIFSAVQFMTAMKREELFHITAIHYGLSESNYGFGFPKSEDLDKLFDWYKKNLKENKDYIQLHKDLKSGELRKKLNENGFNWVTIWFPQ
jgi:ABC-type amino acid transport substrate-binding protein